MSLFNEKLEQINLIGLLILIILLCLVYFLLDFFNISLNYQLINICVIFYFVICLLPFRSGFKDEIQNIFSKVAFKYVLLIVGVNIFFSYGMLYLSGAVIEYLPIKSALFGGVIATVFISPIFEELLFRGVFFNKLKLIVPVHYAIVISSIIFCMFHGYGSYVSAFVFGMCMGILYIFFPHKSMWYIRNTIKGRSIFSSSLPEKIPSLLINLRFFQNSPSLSSTSFAH